jgi:hypothetical protein
MIPIIIITICNINIMIRGQEGLEGLKEPTKNLSKDCGTSSSHGGEYEVQNCLLGCTAV